MALAQEVSGRSAQPSCSLIPPLHPAANARSLQAQAVAAASPEGPYGTNAAQPSRPLLLQQLAVIGHTPVHCSRPLRLGIRLLPSVAAAARRPEVHPFPSPGHYTFLASPAARLAADPAPFPALPALLLFAHPLSFSASRTTRAALYPRRAEAAGTQNRRKTASALDFLRLEGSPSRRPCFFSVVAG